MWVDQVLPIVRLKISDIESPTSYHVLQEDVLNNHQAQTKQPLEPNHVPLYVDNWNRLGLIEVTYLHFLTEEKPYAWVSLRPEYLRYTEQYQAEGRTVSFDKGILKPTPRGLLFAQTVGMTVPILDIGTQPASNN